MQIIQIRGDINGQPYPLTTTYSSAGYTTDFNKYLQDVVTEVVAQVGLDAEDVCVGFDGGQAGVLTLTSLSFDPGEQGAFCIEIAPGGFSNAKPDPCTD